MAASSCGESLARAHDVVSKIDRVVERAYEAHSSIHKTIGDLSGASTIRKDKSVADAARKDIKSTLDAMQSMIATLAQVGDVVERLERRPREKLVSDEVRGILDEHAGYVRLLTEQASVEETNEPIEGAVAELNMSAMRLQIGDVRESIGARALDELIGALKQKHPGLDIRRHAVHRRTRMVVVRIPTVILMSINLMQLGVGDGDHNDKEKDKDKGEDDDDELQLCSIYILADDEQGPISKFQVFQRISYDAKIMWFSLAGFSIEHRISRMVQWFSLFTDLFSATCSICRRHLQIDPRTSQQLPPLWRDADARDSGRAFHYSCLLS
ncbi:hypothetical protein H4R18_001141 [Coemansia javaensis]|uniref:Uncharacterized protein n=1 Tax=Coemansia javaensis TaxID=2761396 RepID=A0A9W8LJM3_9FUNG|nr:hypothetical protein H4R18_001141 [Coemansia javaensis]